MKFVAIDTNVILDFQLKREPGLKIASRIFRDCIDGKLQIYLPEIVFAENEWVLRSVYKKPRSLILSFFMELLGMENILLPNKRKINNAVSFFQETNLKFTDCLIIAEVQEFEPDEFITSDYQLQKVYLRL